MDARHEAGLLRFVRRLLGPRWVAQADEVFQDTWMRIIGALAQYQAQGARAASWKTWNAGHAGARRSRCNDFPHEGVRT